MSTTKKMYDIIDGPNRNDLVAAFLYAYDEDFGKRLCTFTLVDGIQKNVSACA